MTVRSTAADGALPMLVTKSWRAIELEAKALPETGERVREPSDTTYGGFD
jgi:hypothetical protein